MASPDFANIETHSPPPFAADHYEILRVGRQADEETIERVYRTLADRFHPDNHSTGDTHVFMRLKEAYETLSNRDERAKYNVLQKQNGGLTRFSLRGREFFNGVRGGQNRRLAVLCLLYRQMVSSHEKPGLSILDLEQATGCTREELTAALWYLCQKEWATLGEFSAYSITAAGFEVVETELEERLEFRSLATWCYYDPANPEGLAGKKARLPLDIAPVIGADEEICLADYYETLGIGPQADEEAIERVYRTLADRFNPDNPGTGDARTFQQIREAYETLSDPAKRQEYDALLERTRYPDRFRFRAREFFEGIRGEQLRRLAVLCILYRRSAGELPGLTVLDLEHLTGCTREELGSALWFLRQKKWVTYGQFAQYSITAAGLDVVENKLDEQEAVRSHDWLSEEDAPGGDALCLEAGAAQPAVRVQPLILSADSPSGVSDMSATSAVLEQHFDVAVTTAKRVIFSMGGKGGVGKTSVMTGLAEWFEENRIPVALLDLDTENKAKGSLTNFFGGRVPKINIHTPAGLDAFVDILAEDASAILADMGAGAGYITHDWFHKMYPDVSAAGVSFTAVGVVTSDPASVESVVNWAAALEERVDYVIVENNLTEHTDFSCWEQSEEAEQFRRRFQPAIIRLDYRLADLENAARNHGVTLGRVARRTASAPELKKASLVMRAQSARRRMFEEFDKVKELLLPR